MKRYFYFLLVAIYAISMDAQPSRVVNTQSYSKILGTEKPYTVYLPAGYDTDTETRYPVLFLLHGAWGCDRDWTEKGGLKDMADLLMNSGTAIPMIIVMPDARGEGENMGGRHMGYFNLPGWEYERYFFDELIPHVDSTYRTVPDKQHRAIAGLSMGGGASVMYAQHHPEMWSSAVSLSGALTVTPTLQRILNEDGDYNRQLELTDPHLYLQNASPETLEQLRTVRWMADCGDDDFLAECNIDFFRTMRHVGIPLEYRMRDGGHTWLYWNSALPDVMRFVSIGFLTD